MIKRIFGDVPNWAKRENPLLRYEIVRNQPHLTSRARLVRMSGWALIFAFLLLIGYAITTDGFQRGLQMPYTVDIWRILFYPILILQVVLRVAGLSMGVNAISDERRRQTWDNLRSTEMGTEISLRTRWISVLFYRLRGLLVSVMLARIVLVMAILYELTSFQGQYLDILTTRSTPSVPLEFGVILLAGLMTAIVLMPITATGVDVALGLLISSTIRNRALSGILQVLVLIFRVGTTVLLLLLMLQFQNDLLALDSTSAWLLSSGFAVFGDWGLTLTQLTQTGQMWAEIPYSVFIGGLLLLVTLLQVMMASAFLALAVRIAERNE
ncbi:MAG: hypothetical protein Q9P44_18280 [Anaerolineae bacterium]|nr:hypothetical protein [Anaerolineae bacterium]